MGTLSQRNLLIAHYRSDIVSGAENSITDFIEQIDPRLKVTMLVPKEGKLAEFFRNRGIPVWIKAIDTPRRLFPGLHEFQSAVFGNELKRQKIDAVLCNTFPAASRVGTACRNEKIPFAIYMRDYLPDKPPFRSVLAKANALFAISKDIIQYHSTMVDPQKFHLTYNYINPQPILQKVDTHNASGTRLLPFPKENPVIGLVGRITPYKQPDVFLRAIPLILAHHPECRFVLVGSAQEREQEYEAGLRKLAKELGIEQQTAFLGQRNDVVELTAEFTISCLVSDREPLGRVVLEANLIQIPVIVPDTGGPAEIVRNGVTGLYFSSTAKDREMQLAKQVICLLENPSLRQTLTENGYQKMMDTFANRQYITIQENLIEQLCNHEFELP